MLWESGQYEGIQPRGVRPGDALAGRLVAG